MKEMCPLVTIIMPVRNEASSITFCLEAILNQDYPKERLEVVFVDGLSMDGTREIARTYGDRLNMKVIDNPGRIVPTGMNAALRIAQGEIIVRVDGHCIIDDNYVSNCVKHILNDKVDGVGGSMETIGETFLSKTIAVAMSSQFGVGDSSFRTENSVTKLVDTVPFPAYTREIIHKAGQYDEELVRNQDDEYNYRIRELGGKILHSSRRKIEVLQPGVVRKALEAILPIWVLQSASSTKASKADASTPVYSPGFCIGNPDLHS